MDSKNLSQFTKNVSKHVLQTYSSKTTGFWIGLSAAVVAVLQGILYAVWYKQTAFYDSAAVVVSIVGAVIFLLLSASRYSSPFAPVALAVANFFGFLMYVKATYMYLADVFYGGINATSLASIDKEYVICVVMFVVSTVVANVAIYHKQNCVEQPIATEEATDEK